MTLFHDICADGVDWALEAVGRARTIEQSFAALRKGGAVVAIGLGRVGATFEVPINQLVQQEKRLIGSLYGSANTVTDIPKLLELYRAGRLPLDELLGPAYPLSQVNDACQALLDGAVGRVVLDLGHDVEP